MKKRHLLFTMLALSLGCLSGGSEAMAQSTNNGWNAILSQTQTQSTDWTAITAGSTSGMTLGSSGNTTYYYVKGSYNFGSTTNHGVSGLKIQGTVYLYIPNGLSITCVGGYANGATGAGAGIELAAGNTLYIIGGAGTVTATGGNAANGSDGDNGSDASGSSGSWTRTGAGGTGGNGGGGAGAGIGTRGGAGGTGGAGGSSNYYDNGAQDDEKSGTNGSAGNAGSTAGAMGTLYVANGITVNATRGAAGTSGGSGGASGTGYAYDGFSYNVSVGCGGGGGGGAGGAQDYRTNSQGGIYKVTAYGGSGGQNATANGYSRATDGSEGLTTYGNCSVENGSFSSSDWKDASGAVTMGSGGSSGAKGTNSSEGTQNATDDDHNLWYTITYHHVMPSVTTTTAQYSPSTGTTVVLPRNSEGYQWVLGVYGKDCSAAGQAVSEFTAAAQKFYGGNYNGTASRTILLNDVYGNLDFYEVKSVCMLENSGSNTQVITDFFVDESNPANDDPQWPITVRLKDRTLYKDGDWNTICLPFDMTPAQYSASPLAGATIMKLSSELTGYWPNGGTIGSNTYDHAVIYFNFVDAEPNTNGLQRGKPYLVKWSSGNNLVDDTKEAEDEGDNPTHQLDFRNVVVKEATAGAWSGNANSNGTVTFQGTFSSEALNRGDQTKLILGSNNTLYYPKGSEGTLSVAACRGYFTIPSAVAAAAPQMVMGFDDDETTGIQTIDVTPEGWNNAPAIYNLSGQRLNALQKGVNIVNGKKVVVK